MLIGAFYLGSGATHSSLLRFRHAPTGTMVFEVLSDKLFRFQIFPGRRVPELRGLDRTTMVSTSRFAGPTLLKKSDRGFETPDLAVTISESPFKISSLHPWYKRSPVGTTRIDMSWRPTSSLRTHARCNFAMRLMLPILAGPWTPGSCST